MSSLVIGGIVNTLAGAAMVLVCFIARRRNVHARKTGDVLVRWRLSGTDREHTLKRLRFMLAVGMGAGLLEMALGIDSLIVGLLQHNW